MTQSNGQILLPEIELNSLSGRAKNEKIATDVFDMRDNKYTAFGQLLKGYDVLHKIGDVVCEANPNNPSEISHPVEPVKMIKVYLSEYDSE